jgi:hypothetical protein
VTDASRGCAVTGDRAAPPDDAVLLDAWEHARSLERPWRELALLAVVEPGTLEDLAKLPIGLRDRRLLELRISLSGTSFEGEVDCPACGERLDVVLDARLLRSVPRARRSRTIRYGARRIRVRPPDSADIAAGMAAADPEAVLLQRCTDVGDAPPADELRDLVSRTLAALDPGAELVLSAACPTCAEAWQVPIDPGSLAFEEVAQRAQRILGEVDQLARAYGWPERDVLALSPERRRAYVELSAQ